MTVTGGDFATPPELVPADSVDDLIGNIRKLHKSTDLVVSMQQPTRGVRHKGRVLPRLPRSVLDVLASANDSERPRVVFDFTQVTRATKWVLSGSASLSIPISE